MPIVSIIMTAYQRPQYLDQAIDSVISQTLSDWELIVVQDGGVKEVSRIIQSRSKCDSRIQHVRRNIVGTIADATNHGLNLARGEFAAILDDDDYWLSPEKLRRQIDFLDNNKEYVACGTGVVVIDPNGQEIMRYQKPYEDSQLRQRSLLANPIAHSSVLFRLEVAREIRFYDSQLSVCQDWEFWLRLGLRGKIGNLPNFDLAYRLWPSSTSATKHRDNARSAITVIWRHRKHYPFIAFGLLVALGYWVYSCMPQKMRTVSFRYFSTGKKRFFAI